MRLDRWLWSVRAFPSRTAAAEAIRERRVLVDGVPGKPAHEVRLQEVITILTWRRERMLRVIGLPRSRLAGKLVAACAEPVAPLPD